MCAMGLATGSVQGLENNRIIELEGSEEVGTY